MSQECNCCCSQCPPWWVTMGFTPPLQLTQANTPSSNPTLGSTVGGVVQPQPQPQPQPAPAQSSSSGGGLLGGLGNILTGGLSSLF